jgi:hypothetical protein
MKEKARRQRETERDRERQRETEGQKDRVTERQRDRETERQRQFHRFYFFSTGGEFKCPKENGWECYRQVKIKLTSPNLIQPYLT